MTKNDTPDKALVERLRGAKPNCNFGSTLCARDAHMAADAIERISQPQHGGLVEALDALEGMVRLSEMGLEASLREPEENGNFASYERAKRVVAKYRTALASNSPVVGEDYKLPCDVHVPHSTVIKAGCSLSTLKLAMELEGRPKSFEDHPRKSLPTPTDTADRIVESPAIENCQSESEQSNRFTQADRREAVARIIDPVAFSDKYIGNRDLQGSGFFVRREARRAAVLVKADAILPLIAVPSEGFVMVPVEPTEAMLFAGDDAAAGPQDLGDGLTRAIWAAMIAAATGEA